MASIKKYNGSWRATVKRKGFTTKPLVAHFPTKAEAEEWAYEQERDVRRQAKGMSPSTELLNKHTVRSIVERYRDEKSAKKGSARSEVACLNKFLRRTDIADKTLISFKKPDVYKYRDLRMQDTYAGVTINYRTVSREFAVMHHIWETAREEWGIPIVDNPWSKIKAPPGHKKTKRRKRRLRVGELHRILEACGTCDGINKLIMPFAIELCIETGMRLQEIMNLKWEDINLDTRRIEIRKSKTDYKSDVEGRTIVMTLMAKYYLQGLKGNASKHDIEIIMKQHGVSYPEALAIRHTQPRSDHSWLRSTANVFPPTEDGKPRIEAFKQVWKYVVEKAEIPGKHHAYTTRKGVTVEPDGEGLTFHDLRHEAGSLFDSAGLTKGQHDLMMGHSNRDMASLYIHAELDEIQKKLDADHRPRIEANPNLMPEEKEFILVLNFETSNEAINGPDEKGYWEDDYEETEIILPPNVVQLFKKLA